MRPSVVDTVFGSSRDNHPQSICEDISYILADSKEYLFFYPTGILKKKINLPFVSLNI